MLQGMMMVFSAEEMFKLVVSIQVTLELPDLNYTYARVPPQRLI